MKSANPVASRPRIAAFGLAALMSLGTLAGIEGLAAAPAPAGLLARMSAPARLAAAPGVLPAAAATPTSRS